MFRLQIIFTGKDVRDVLASKVSQIFFSDGAGQNFHDLHSAGECIIPVALAMTVENKEILSFFILDDEITIFNRGILEGIVIYIGLRHVKACRIRAGPMRISQFGNDFFIIVAACAGQRGICEVSFDFSID